MRQELSVYVKRHSFMSGLQSQRYTSCVLCLGWRWHSPGNTKLEFSWQLSLLEKLNVASFSRPQSWTWDDNILSSHIATWLFYCKNCHRGLSLEEEWHRDANPNLNECLLTYVDTMATPSFWRWTLFNGRIWKTNSKFGTKWMYDLKDFLDRSRCMHESIAIKIKSKNNMPCSLHPFN